ncbi:natural UGA frame-shift [Chlamydia pneumoniae J138]|nr:natural UGA frame-shift [Chlamydia pneumoniae J138]
MPDTLGFVVSDLQSVQKFFQHEHCLAKNFLRNFLLLKLEVLFVFYRGQRDLAAKDISVRSASKRLSKFSCITLTNLRFQSRF